MKESEAQLGDPVVLLFSFGTLGDRKKLGPCGSPIPELLMLSSMLLTQQILKDLRKLN